VVVGARRRATRRGFFRGAGITVVAGASSYVAACGDDDGTTMAKTGPADVDVLNSLLELEYTAVAGYRAGAPLLRGEVLASARRFLEQEQAHADALVRAIRQIGGRPIKPKAKYDFPTLSDQTDFLSFASDLEKTTIAVYIDSLPKLTERSLRGTAAAIVTTEAEHLSVIRRALGRSEAPSAFATGQPSDDS
jgi:rubrerythrin